MGEITYREGVYRSSNVVFVLFGQRLGQDRMIRYIERFGFGRITDSTGRKTGMDLPAQAKDIFSAAAYKSPNWPPPPSAKALP